MGNSSSSSGRGHHDDSVDYGFLVPQGVYTGPRDWNQAIVSQLIINRRLAPFYRPLEDYIESWDDDQILAARKELPDQPDNNEHASRSDSIPHSASSKSTLSKRSVPPKEVFRPEAAIYRGAVECPICFLYYPPNINHSRCCDQAICTECFVQIKRNEPTTTHLVSEPAACPYCVQENFGVVYAPPQWRAGIGSEGQNLQSQELPKEPSPQILTHKRRQKSYSADSPEVVTTDQIRPDWEAKLAAIRAAVTRRANRRIIMRQVGDRLIPVGVTSGRVHALNPEEAAAEGTEGRGSRRQRRANHSQLEQFMGIPGQDLEELMLMEAMRLSLLEHEEQQRKEAEEKRKQEAAAAAGGEAPTNSTGGASSEHSSSALPPTAGPSTLNVTTQAVTSSTSVPQSTVPNTLPGEGSSEIRFASASRGPTPPSLASHESPSGDSVTRGLRIPNPLPFSTLNAALGPASAATAILRSSSSQQGASPDSRHDCDRTVQSITNAHVESSQTRQEASLDDNLQRPPLSLMNTTSSDYSQDRLNPSSSYGQLPSSPDSGVINEPLLGSNSKLDANLEDTTATSSDDKSPSTSTRFSEL